MVNSKEIFPFKAPIHLSFNSIVQEAKNDKTHCGPVGEEAGSVCHLLQATELGMRAYTAFQICLPAGLSQVLSLPLNLHLGLFSLTLPVSTKLM